MQIILLDKVKHLGNLGDVVRVKDGYARNYLIPQKKAKSATKQALKEFELLRTELEKIQIEKLNNAIEISEKLSKIELNILQKAGVDGRLFGSVTNIDILNALQNKGFKEIKKFQIVISEGHIKYIGTYNAQITLHPDVIVDVHFNVLDESSTK
ncbi:50S ribosomal protein L9 [Candidatus Kinetoplastibacterium sorsogonicusi]|uniref:Large ribosomal subunit protein bL9 n=1 Tax=Candidatus Kinetoplastidibacterium kentomonadis TaxID=1576550 RepID=A0A3Q8EWZ8_9PROT|nr:50S ribosomal protein L9 [Candidatus Kinetoplastibacterium sorsogonicusi]AWD32473.1 50S ribosomal protein L9 [Candidatus Kinetoplastibacterium sorsogonicusi]